MVIGHKMLFQIMHTTIFQIKHTHTNNYTIVHLLVHVHLHTILRFMTAHIWACPPSEGDDYIFHCHPLEQKVPKPKRLVDWYKKMLDKGRSDNVVHDYRVSQAYSIMQYCSQQANNHMKYSHKYIGRCRFRTVWYKPQHSRCFVLLWLATNCNVSGARGDKGSIACTILLPVYFVGWYKCTCTCKQCLHQPSWTGPASRRMYNTHKNSHFIWTTSVYGLILCVCGLLNTLWSKQCMQGTSCRTLMITYVAMHVTLLTVVLA